MGKFDVIGSPLEGVVVVVSFDVEWHGGTFGHFHVEDCAAVDDESIHIMTESVDACVGCWQVVDFGDFEEVF